jgi:hypothetical protein
MVRLFWVTELFGNVAPTFTECLIAFVVGFIAGSLALAIRETRRNERDQSAELADLCAKMGFTYSTPASPVELGPLADSPLLKRYAAILTRLCGVVRGYPFEMLDVSRWVERRDDTSSRFEWRHTLVVFPAQTKLPNFRLLPLALADRWLHAFAGAKGVTFVHGIGDEDRDVREQFQAHYFVWPGDQPYYARQDTAVASQTPALGAVFSAEVATFFAEHPGWCVEVADGLVALWREGRVVEPAGRPALLADAAAVYQMLTESPASRTAASGIIPEKPLDLRRASNLMVRLFAGIGVGIWVGFFVGGGVLYLLIPLVPEPPPGWFVLVVFPVLVLGGMLLGGCTGYHVVRRYLWPPE